MTYITNTSNRPNVAAVDDLSQNASLESQSKLDTLLAKPAFTFAGFGNDGENKTPPARPGILDKSYDSKGKFIGNEVEYGQIVINGPPRMPTKWEQLSLLQQIQWVALFAYYNDDRTVDIIMETDISGKNPDNPYISQEESNARFKAGMDNVKNIHDQPPAQMPVK